MNSLLWNCKFLNLLEPRGKTEEQIELILLCISFRKAYTLLLDFHYKTAILYKVELYVEYSTIIHVFCLECLELRKNL